MLHAAYLNASYSCCTTILHAQLVAYHEPVFRVALRVESCILAGYGTILSGPRTGFRHNV